MSHTIRLLTLLAVGVTTAAVTTSSVNAATGVPYSFQNTNDGYYLYATGDAATGDPLAASNSPVSPTQVFYLRSVGTQTYTMESASQPGKCATNHDVPWTIWLRDCNTSDIKQQWVIDLSASTTTLRVKDISDGCMGEQEGSVNLLHCVDIQHPWWRPIAQ